MASTVAVESPAASHFPHPDGKAHLSSKAQPLCPHEAAVKDPLHPGAHQSTGAGASASASASSSASASANGKRKQTKSRNGCVTCKAKRLKCDETHPHCKQCARRSVPCGGYKKEFKWRPFEDTTAARPKRASSPPPLPCAAAPAPLHDPNRQTHFTIHVPPDHHALRNSYQPQAQAQAQALPLPLPPGFPEPSQALMNRMFAIPDLQPFELAPPPISPVDSFVPSSESTTTTLETASAKTQPSMTSVASSVSSGQSPRLVDLLQPGTDLSDLPEEYMSFREQHEAFYQPTGLTPPADALDDLVDEIPRNFDQSDWPARLPSPAPSDSSSSSAESRDLTLYQRPRLSMTSPEMLTRRFDQETCGILSVKDGPTENPWRTLIWPLTRDSPALYHAMLSMTSFHHSRDSPAFRIQGIDHMRTAVHALASGMDNMRVDAAISTTIALAFSESWDQHISTGINHIKGARILIDRALVQHSQRPVRGQELTRLKFLCNSWMYIDVIARLTSADTDESSDYDSVLEGLHLGEDDACQLDPLMGCAQTLFPIIGRVANLVRKVRSIESNTSTVISEAIELKRQLQDWMPPSYIEDPEDETTSPHDSIKTATAYQYATLLYLHQAVPEIPSLTSAVLAQKIVRELATVDHRSRSTIIHIYPLMSAGCELVDPVDRQWICDRWDLTSSRMKIGIIERCLEVTKEVWSRRDAYAAELALDQQIDGTSSIYSATPSLKRQFSSVSEDSSAMEDASWLEPSAKARATEPIYDPDGDFCWLDPTERWRAISTSFGFEHPRRVPIRSQMSGGMRRSEIFGTETLPPELTVKGRLHWLGVMKDWNWEVLLG